MSSLLSYLIGWLYHKFYVLWFHMGRCTFLDFKDANNISVKNSDMLSDINKEIFFFVKDWFHLKRNVIYVASLSLLLVLMIKVDGLKYVRIKAWLVHTLYETSLLKIFINEWLFNTKALTFHWHVVKHGVESGVFFGVEFGVRFGVEFGVKFWTSDSTPCFTTCPFHSYHMAW